MSLRSYLINHRLEFQFQMWTKDPTPNKISTPKRILRAIKNSKLNQNDGVSWEFGLIVGRYGVGSSGRKSLKQEFEVLQLQDWIWSKCRLHLPLSLNPENFWNLHAIFHSIKASFTNMIKMYSCILLSCWQTVSGLTSIPNPSLSAFFQHRDQ